MAIAKIKKSKFEITTKALIQMIVAGVLVVVSFVLGWQAFVKWRFKVNLVDGYESYGSNQTATARVSLETALRWEPAHPGARELLAKILCDAGSLDASEREYRQLMSQGYAPPQVHASLGVVYLKKADAATAPKDVEALIKQAQAEFALASSIPEGAIGRGHCEILMAFKNKDNARIEATRKIFEGVEKEMKNRSYAANCTRDGLVDYYSGLGRALASGGKYNETAAKAFKSCYQYARRWPLPMANMMLVETQKLAETTYNVDELARAKLEVNAIRTQMGHHWKTNFNVFGSLKEPWLKLTLALCLAHVRTGDLDGYTHIMQNELLAGTGFESRVEPPLFDAMVKTEVVMRTENLAQMEPRIITAMNALAALLARPAINDDGWKSAKALALNDLAWMKAWRGSFNQNDQFLAEAVDHMDMVVKMFPDDYVYNRNLVLIMHRAKRDPKTWQPFLDKAKEKAGTEFAEDYQKLLAKLEGR